MQMYKIYINDIPLFLRGFEHYHSGDAKNLTAVYMNKPVTLLQYVDTLEKTNTLESITIFSKDVQRLKNDFFDLYKIVEAAGGLVFNEKDELLVIFRRGHWDLPKGKIDFGETKEEASVREVMEETSLVDVKRNHFIGETYHTFQNRHGKRILKKSYWYEMEASHQKGKPQKEEDIEIVEWEKPHSFLHNFSPIYPNIKEIIHQYLNSKEK